MWKESIDGRALRAVLDKYDAEYPYRILNTVYQCAERSGDNYVISI